MGLGARGRSSLIIDLRTVLRPRTAALLIGVVPPGIGRAFITRHRHASSRVTAAFPPRSGQHFNSLMQPGDKWFLGWLVIASAFNFLLFSYDKLRAGASNGRIPESWLVLMGACGGWIGGLAAMLTFRHKTAKLSFQLKYAAALVIQLGLLLTYLRFR